MSWHCARCGIDQAFEGNDVCGHCREQIYQEEQYAYEQERLAAEAEMERAAWEEIVREEEP